MGLILAAGLVLAAGLPCEKRSSDLSAPPASPLVKLGRPALAGLPSCGEGEIPVHASPPVLSDLPPRPEHAPEERGCAPQGCWAWAGWNDRRPMRGAGARLSIEGPAVVAPDHSLAEVALQWGGSEHEIVEVGWEVAPRRHGDSEPHLFVHRWVKGRPCAAPCGFVRWSPRLWPGMSLARWTGKDLTVGWLLWEGRAWAWADGEWLGAFALDAVDAPRLARVAQWFGEVFFVRPPPRVSMGNGLAGNLPGAARVTMVCDVPEQDPECVVRPERFPRVTEPGFYPMRTDSDGGFHYGGPAQATPSEVRPPPPPSSASEGTPPATGRSAPSPPR